MTGFDVSPDNQKVRCKLCNNPSPERACIAIRSFPAHLKSIPHQKAIELNAESVKQGAAIAREQAEDAQYQIAAGFQDVIMEPVGEPSAQSQTGAEREMWLDFDGGANIDFGMDAVVDVSLDRIRLEREAREFGIWNADSIAQELGFGDNKDQPLLGDDDEQDAFLAEIMANAGELTLIAVLILAVISRYLTDSQLLMIRKQTMVSSMQRPDRRRIPTGSRTILRW